MSLIPSLEDFRRQQQQPWLLSWSESEGLILSLIKVSEETAMSARYQCYSALFAQPEEVRLPQHTYRLQSPEGQAWDVLLTPVGLDEETDRQLLQAVFHVKRPPMVETTL